MKRLLSFLMLVVLAGAGTYVTCPTLRTRIAAHTQSWLLWSEQARQADPVGFTNHVERRLTEDVAALEETRRTLHDQLTAVSRERIEQVALQAHAQTLAEEFRQVYQKTEASDSFPMTVREAAYTRTQAVSQVSLLLAQADGYRQAVEKLTALQKQVEQRLEELTVRIESTRVQLAAIGAQRGLLQARVLSDEGARLVAQVDQLLDTNRQAVHDNPVRNVSELLAAGKTQPMHRPSVAAAREFLTSVTKPEAGKEPQVRKPRTAKRTGVKAQKPIQQQF